MTTSIYRLNARSPEPEVTDRNTICLLCGDQRTDGIRPGKYIRNNDLIENSLVGQREIRKDTLHHVP